MRQDIRREEGNFNSGRARNEKTENLKINNTMEGE
jgi:hypothetical protein